MACVWLCFPSPTAAGPASGEGANSRVGLCILVSRSDLHVRDAVVVRSSGDGARDRALSQSVVGMHVPAPVTLTSDFWAPLWLMDVRGGGSAPLVDAKQAGTLTCRALNLRLCGLADCKTAPALK
jgi:hypothetical protein